MHTAARLPARAKFVAFVSEFFRSPTTTTTQTTKARAREMFLLTLTHFSAQKGGRLSCAAAADADDGDDDGLSALAARTNAPYLAR